METSEQVLQAARALDPACELVVPKMKDGDCMIFLGTMWHGTHNTSTRDRYAVTLQYSDVATEVKVPMNFEMPVRWHSQKPEYVNLEVDK